MAIPSSEREQILVSSTNNERQSQAVVVKGTYWNVYSAFGNLHIHEFGGAYALRISASTPQFHVTNALDEFGVLRADRFWLWKIDSSNNLDLVEIEPVVNGDPIIHDTTRIDTGVGNIRANVSDGKPVVVYTVTTTPDLIVKIYTDVKSAIPAKIVNMNWSGTRLPDLDSESYDDQIRVAFIDVLSPPNVYTEDYELSTSEITTYTQTPDILQINLEWEEVDGAESYRVERSIDDPLFADPDVIYSGPLLAFVDAIPSWNTSYYYRAKIEVPSLGLESVWSTIQQVDVGPPALVADFDSDVTSGDASLIVNFTDESSGAPETWDWDFGDGSAHDYTQNPQHTYSMAGTYTVSLTVTSPGASDTETKTGYITVNMVSMFSGDVTSGDAQLIVQFTDESLGIPDTWSWDFGDGSPLETSQNPLHTYTKAGTFTVALTASNSGASDIHYRTAYISVTMVAGFSSDVVSGDAPLSVNFDDETLGEPDTWDWDFGDGSPHGDTENPTHVYSRAGTYDVTLIASSSGGTDAITMASYISVAMVADFGADHTSGDNPLNVQFSDSTTGMPDTWDWDFGDDTPHSNLKNPLHVYTAPGAHTVILTASNSDASDEETKLEYITVGPIAEFSGDPRVGSSGLVVHFTDESTEGCMAWEWDFGDGSPHSFEQNPIHKYENNGQYDVTLISTNIYGSGTTTKLNYIQIRFVFDDPYEPIDEARCVGVEPGKVTFWDYLSTFWNNLDEKSRDAFENFWDGMVRAGNHLKKMANRFSDAQAPEYPSTCVLEDYYDIKIGPLHSIPINLDPTNKNPQYLITPIERVLVEPSYNKYNDRIYDDRLAISASDYYKIRTIGIGTYAVVEPKDRSIEPKWFKVKNLLSSEEPTEGPDAQRHINPKSATTGTYIVELVNADLAYLEEKPFTFYLTTARAYTVQPWVIELPYLQINISTKEEYDFTNGIDYVLYNNVVEFSRDIVDSREVPDGASVYCRWTKAMEYMLFETFGSIVGIPDWQMYNYGNISGKTAINALLKSLQNPTNREDMERAVHVYYGLPIAPDYSEIIGLYESYGYTINYVGEGGEEGWIQLDIKAESDLHPFVQVGSRLHIDGKRDLIISEIDPDRSLARVKVSDASQIVLGDECNLRLRNSFSINRVYAESAEASKIDIVSPEGGAAIQHIIDVVQAVSGGTRYPEIAVYGTGEAAGNYDGIYHVTNTVTDGQIVTLSLYKKPDKGNALYNDCIKASASNLRSGFVHVPWPTHKYLLLQMKDQYFKAYLDAPIDTLYDANDKVEKYQTMASNVAIVNNGMFDAWDEFDHFKLENKVHRENTMLQLVHSIPDARFGEYFPSSFVVF